MYLPIRKSAFLPIRNTANEPRSPEANKWRIKSRHKEEWATPKTTPFTQQLGNYSCGTAEDAKLNQKFRKWLLNPVDLLCFSFVVGTFLFLFQMKPADFQIVFVSRFSFCYSNRAKNLLPSVINMSMDLQLELLCRETLHEATAYECKKNDVHRLSNKCIPTWSVIFLSKGKIRKEHWFDNSMP